eukprot:TRINITY_DN1357_c0_g2_i3.p1 TRINITY_DN1357_c0_g2~~TRINITY_DN1357_c0_g2_i3.p1  ORF type:complete len:381 (+),score=151.35 TRINITY_DN1357_c0_g2_i3:44-1144(+)
MGKRDRERSRSYEEDEDDDSHKKRRTSSSSSSSSSKSSHHHHKKSSSRHSHSHSHSHSHKSSKSKSSSSKKKSSSSDLGELHEILASKGVDGSVIQQVSLLTIDDYYRRSGEFRIWLAKKKKRQFEDLDRDEADRLFGKFCKKWNTGGLNTKFYTGELLGNNALVNQTRTSHSWSFKGVDAGELEDVQTSVHFHSEKTKQVPRGDTGIEFSSSSSSSSSSSTSSNAIPLGGGGGAGNNSNRNSDRGDRRGGKKQLSYQQRQHRDHMMELAEEFEPVNKGTKKQEMRKAMGAQNRARDRELSPDIGEDVAMGGGDDFRSAMQREKQRKEYRQKKKSEKVDHYKQKEDEKMAQIHALLGAGWKNPLAK